MNRTTSGSALAIALVASVVATSASSRAEPKAIAPDALVPHEATYAMHLSSSRSGSGVVGASGTMYYSFADTCDGYAVNTRTLLSLSYGAGTPVLSAWEFTTWESKDGSQYRFQVRNSRNGQLIETIDGRAHMPRDATEKGSVEFFRPTKHTADLPVGTLFPTEHTRLLLEEADSGSRFIIRNVFDGSGDRGTYEVSALIGNRQDGVAVGPEHAATTAERISGALLEGPAWTMSMAFFPEGSAAPTPEFQVGLTYHDNGVAERVVQDFGDFTISGELTDLKPLERPEC